MTGMHGDLVNGLCYTAFAPVYLWMWFSDPEPGAAFINFFFLVTAISCWYSWWYLNVAASICASVSMSMSIVGMNLYQWPHKGEVVVIPQFLWSLVIISANVANPFLIKAGAGLQALGMALFVAYQSPLLQLSDALPTLLGATAVHILFHYFADRKPAGSKHEQLSARLASVVLAGAFAYHTASELSTMLTMPDHVKHGGYSILKVGFFAVLGLAAAGAFEKQVDLKLALESLVQERTKEVVKQASELRMVGFALQASETAIAIADSRFRLVWANAALEKLLTRQNNLGSKTLVEALGPSQETVGRLQSCFDVDRVGRADIMLGAFNYTVEVSPFPSHERSDKLDSDGSRFLVVLKDVTELKAREDAEKIAQKQVMLKQAMQESMETLSHELRTPLQAIMGMSSLLLDNPSATVDEARESMSIIMASSRHLLTLINNLLDVRKCDANMMDEFQLSPMKLSTSLTDAANFCRPMATIMNVSLRLTVGSACKDACVLSNTLRFQQVMINLVSNAIKYTPLGSTICLTTELMSIEKVKRQMDNALSVGLAREGERDDEAGDVVVVSVCDEGPGISQSVAGRIFSKFSQVTTHRSSVIGGNSVAQPSGTGLGLNLCLKFVKRMRGNIWVSNSAAKGSCFSFYLPVVDMEGSDHSPASMRSASPSSECSESTPSRVHTPIGSQRVLVVDDTIINLKVLERMLNRVGVTKLATVDSGAKALSLLEGQQFDLVITDIQMPEMTGTELSDAICEKGCIATKPIVVGLTAETSEALLGRCASSGMSHVLYKPITTTQIQHFFEHILPGLERCDTYKSLRHNDSDPRIYPYD